MVEKPEYSAMKPFVFALFLAAPFFAFAGSSHKNISAQISVLGENMPSKFSIGQARQMPNKITLHRPNLPHFSDTNIPT